MRPHAARFIYKGVLLVNTTDIEQKGKRMRSWLLHAGAQKRTEMLE